MKLLVLYSVVFTVAIANAQPNFGHRQRMRQVAAASSSTTDSSADSSTTSTDSTSATMTAAPTAPPPLFLPGPYGSGSLVPRPLNVSSSPYDFNHTRNRTHHSNTFSHVYPGLTSLVDVSSTSSWAAAASSTATSVAGASYVGGPAAAIQTVTVGGAIGNVYSPAFYQGVAQGSRFHFDFYDGNHTLTESTFDDPCTKLQGTDIDTDYNNQNPDNIVNFHPYDYTFASSAARYFFCKQPDGDHCANGMVFAVNVDDATYAQFVANAMATKTKRLMDNHVHVDSAAKRDGTYGDPKNHKVTLDDKGQLQKKRSGTWGDPKYHKVTLDNKGQLQKVKRRNKFDKAAMRQRLQELQDQVEQAWSEKKDQKQPDGDNKARDEKREPAMTQEQANEFFEKIQSDIEAAEAAKQGKEDPSSKKRRIEKKTAMLSKEAMNAQIQALKDQLDKMDDGEVKKEIHSLADLVP